MASEVSGVIVHALIPTLLTMLARVEGRRRSKNIWKDLVVHPCLRPHLSVDAESNRWAYARGYFMQSKPYAALLLGNKV